MPEQFALDLDLEKLKREIDPELERAAGNDTVGSLLAARAPSDTRAKQPSTFWENVRSEFRIFLCTKNKKYKAERDAFAALGKKSTTSLVGLLTGAIVASLGGSLLISILVPFVALLLYTSAEMGREAYCR
jgi:hypothetical protein